MPGRMDRRRFVRDAVRAAAGCVVGQAAAGAGGPKEAGGMPKWEVRTLTSGPKHHFFGYYGIPPWNRSQRRMVCLESDFQDHLPAPEEAARVGLVDPQTGAFTRIAETRGWNLQQGAMLSWSPLDPENEILFNDRREGDVCAVALDVRSGKERLLPRGLAGVGWWEPFALCLDYGRLARLRPVVGYVGARDPYPDDPHPERDGVFLMDLRTGKTELVVSYAEVYRRLERRHPELKERHLFFNHTVFNRDDSRFFFLARTFTPERRLETGMFTCNRDGSDLREVIPYGTGVSHFDWRNTREIVATYRFDGPELKHVLFTDGRDDHRVVGDEVLVGDGHCSFSPDQQWIVTDRNHDATLEKSLHLYRLATGEHAELGRFAMRERRYLTTDTRCDLHPRWNRSGDTICFDALEPQAGTRQVHLVTLKFP